MDQISNLLKNVFKTLNGRNNELMLEKANEEENDIAKGKVLLGEIKSRIKYFSQKVSSRQEDLIRQKLKTYSEEDKRRVLKAMEIEIKQKKEEEQSQLEKASKTKVKQVYNPLKAKIDRELVRRGVIEDIEIEYTSKKNKKRKNKKNIDSLKSKIDKQLEKRKEKSRKELEKKKDFVKADRFIKKIQEIIESNKFSLSMERQRCISKDPYGKTDLTPWIGSPNTNIDSLAPAFSLNFFEGFEKGIPYFWRSEILPRIGGKKNTEANIKVFFSEYKNYCLCYPSIRPVKGKKRPKEIGDWYIEIATMIELACMAVEKNTERFDQIGNGGIAFEQYCKSILKNAGWVVEDTSTTGDQGVDLIASIEDLRVCIQCKCFEKPVGNKAVQEITAGRIHWKGTHSVVVAKSGFTKSAQQLAESTNVILISPLELENLENHVL
tara:strand:- start:242 stop:1549 length:1308 start_codon:yes stop_codon:yes gene_type:complete